MFQLTREQRDFLFRHKIALNQVFDATGMKRKEYQEDPRGSMVLQANRELHARLFALVGHLDPDNIEILISTAPCPDPLSWDYP